MHMNRKVLHTPKMLCANATSNVHVSDSNHVSIYSLPASRKYSDIGCSPPGHYRDTAHYMHVVLADEVAIS